MSIMHRTGSRMPLLARLMSARSQSLPHLPVPPLNQTLDKFLTSVRPLLSTDQYQHACQLVEKFGRPDGCGERLQALLCERARNTANWLEEWWLNYAYLQYRLPVPIHVNPGILTPRLAFQGMDEQLRYAAKIICRILEYKKLIDEDKIPVEYMKDSELCMSQYFRIFNCCRVPGASRDLVKTFPAGHPDSPRHIIVMHNGHMFSLEVADTNGQPYVDSYLYQQLSSIMKRSQHPTAPVGLLTTQHRDTWFKSYTLLNQDVKNQENLTEIESSMFLLSLDNMLPVTNGLSVDTIHLNQLNHGGGSQGNSGNRWFDKILQVIVSPDGLIGFNYEHSAAEGPPIVQLIDYCFSNLDKNFTTSNTQSSGSLPKQLEFNISPSVKQAIDDAAKSFDSLIDDLDLIYYSFNKFGKEFLKSQKLSPDAFIQVCFQLAYYRLYGHSVPTYESGSLRKFVHGRTDTIRSCTPASHAYCKAMIGSSEPLAYKAACLRAAVKAHQQYTEQVVNGNGIDRHLLGLKLIAVENGLPVPELLTDSVYESTCYWKISTSQVPSRTGGLLCFGPVVPDGYGICYNPMDNKLLFSISSWRSCQHTDAKRFSASLEQSLLDGQYLLTNVNSSTSAKL